MKDLALPDADGSNDPMFANCKGYFQTVALFDVKSGRSAEDYRAHVRIASFSIGDATGQKPGIRGRKGPGDGKVQTL